MEVRKQQANSITSKSGFPAYTRFFPTMLRNNWDTLEALNELLPLHEEFSRNYNREDPYGNFDVVTTWLFRGLILRLITQPEYSKLERLVGCR